MKKKQKSAGLNQVESETPEKPCYDYQDRLPDDFPGLADPGALLTVLSLVPDLLSGKRRLFEYKDDSKTVFLLKNDQIQLRKILTGLVKEYGTDVKNVGVFREKEGQFILIVTSPAPGSPWPEAGSGTLDQAILDRDRTSQIGWSVHPDETGNGPRSIGLYITNISSMTLVHNLFETIENQPWSSVWIQMRTRISRSLKYLYRVRTRFEKELKKRDRQSLTSDFKRYLQPLIQARSLFDIIGPAMVGPSSSHTAGANRIGRIARHILLALLQSDRISRIDRLEVKLLGSFRDTGLGHYSPQAIAGGLCGLAAADSMLISRGTRLIKERGELDLEGYSIRFNGFKKGTRAEDEYYRKENNSNIAEISAFTGADVFTITGFSLGSGNVEVRYVNGSKLKNGAITGKKDVFLNMETAALVPDGDRAVLIPGLDPAGPPLKQSLSDRLPFNTFEEMLEIFGSKMAADDLIDKILTIEEGISGLSATAAREKMSGYWRIMETAIQTGLTNNDRSLSGLSGGDSGRLAAFEQTEASKPFGNGLHALALRYAIAVNEVNAGSGLIVACPTGGSCGLLPGILRAWQETRTDLSADRSSELIINSLFVAGQLGMILFDDVPTAGAILGCQAEVGGAAAMSAAALTFLQNGTLEQILAAFTLALKNCMGLVCDPVAGLVEVPCVKRNGLYSSLAISAAQLALSGIRSQVSTDEVVLAVREVGERLHEDYKETSRGGLATTRDGKKVTAIFQQRNRSFFSRDSWDGSKT